MQFNKVAKLAINLFNLFIYMDFISIYLLNFFPPNSAKYNFFISSKTFSSFIVSLVNNIYRGFW